MPASLTAGAAVIRARGSLRGEWTDREREHARTAATFYDYTHIRLDMPSV